MAFQTVDNFKHFNYDGIEDDGEALDFEDTYDGLGDALDDDTFRDDDETFGASAVDLTADFDFSGGASKNLPHSSHPAASTTAKPEWQQPSQTLNKLQEPQMKILGKSASTQQQPSMAPPAFPALRALAAQRAVAASSASPSPPLQQQQHPVRSSYEQPPPAMFTGASAPPPKFLSLEEVEAQLLSSTHPNVPPAQHMPLSHFPPQQQPPPPYFRQPSPQMQHQQHHQQSELRSPLQHLQQPVQKPNVPVGSPQKFTLFPLPGLGHDRQASSGPTASPPPPPLLLDWFLR